MKTRRTLQTCMVFMRVVSCIFVLLLSAAGCSSAFWGGAAVGAVGTGAAYEYSTKRQMDRLEEDYRAGNITREEYEVRKEAIEEGSIIY